MVVEIIAPAEAELALASGYYADISMRLRDRFLDEFKRTIARMQRFPKAGASVSGDVRREMLNVFPYNLVYVERAEKLIVVAVMHQKQRPGYWKNRLKKIPSGL